MKSLRPGLVLLFGIQVGILFLIPGRGPGVRGPWLQVGDDIHGEMGVDSVGVRVPIVDGEPTVVLVFHSTCGHSRAVLPEWRGWLEGPGKGLRVVGVSGEGGSVAREYAKSVHLHLPVLRVVGESEGGTARALVARTPWVFFFDGAGLVVAHGPGAGIWEMIPGPGKQAKWGGQE